MPRRQPSPLAALAGAALTMALALGVKLAVQAAVGAPLTEAAPFVLLGSAVLISSLYGGWRAGGLAAALGCIGTIYFFIEPAFSFERMSANRLAQVGLFLLESALITGLCGYVRLAQRRLTRERERLQRLYQARSREREWLDVTLRSIGDAVIATDGGGRINFMNPVAEELTGWPAAEAAGRHLDEVFRIVNEQTRVTVESPVSKVLRERRIVGLANHTILLARDGREHPIDDSGAPIGAVEREIAGVVLVFRDVSERKRAEQRAELLSAVSATIHGSLDAPTVLGQLAEACVPALADWCVIDLLAPDGTLQQVALVHRDPRQAAALARLREQYPTDPDGPYGFTAVLRSGQSQLLPAITPELLRGLALDPGHLALLEALGLRANIAVPLAARGRMLGALSLAIAESGREYDEADLRFAEELGRRAALAVDNAQLYAQSQAALRERDQFLAIAAHELKTPITTIMGNAELLDRRLARLEVADERIARTAATVIRQSQRLTDLIHLLLDVSRLQSGMFRLEPQPVDLAELAARVAEELRLGAEPHRLVVEAGGPLPVRGDPLRLDQVAQNLIQNAVKYSEAGSLVTVSAFRENGQAVLAVADQGIGIPSADLGRLFDRYYRASNATTILASGMGIGLFLVKEIMAAHGGSVSVESREGSGSTFRVALPLAEGDG